MFDNEFSKSKLFVSLGIDFQKGIQIDDRNSSGLSRLKYKGLMKLAFDYKGDMIVITPHKKPAKI
jgi:hypothetical protein